MKTIILGARGMLGSELVGVFPDATALDHEDLDVTDKTAVEEKIKGLRPELVINAAAYTDVDGAESNKETCFNVNAYSVENLAKVCSKINAVLVHFSTDYVFDGEKKGGYKEDDEVGPLNVYGESKALSEKFLVKNTKKYYIIRTSWLYGRYGKNFVNNILRIAKEQKALRVVDDQFGCPTYAKDLAQRIKGITGDIPGLPFGIYHLTNSGFISWFGFAKEIMRLSNMKVELVPITSDELNRPAKRPKCSILLNTKLSPLRRWDDALKEYMEVL